MSPKEKSYVLFNEVGNKLNQNKDLRYFFAFFYNSFQLKIDVTKFRLDATLLFAAF